MLDENVLLNREILISGAGCAGQVVAYWLHRHGFRPTVIETAPGPRIGGFATDLRGIAVDIADRMGILEHLRQERVNMQEIAFYDRAGNVLMQMPGTVDPIDLEILRDDLTRILQSHVQDGIEYIYDTSIESMQAGPDNVIVTLRSGEQRVFDLVLGADGLHSKVRALAFGPEADFVSHLGYYVGIFTIPNLLNMDRQWHICFTPGRMINALQYGLDKHTRAMFTFERARTEFDRRDIDQQVRLIEEVMKDETSWATQTLLAALKDADDLYFDEVSQVHMDSWSTGRVALLGDAAYAPSLITGQGTSLALAGGYVLAGELKAAGGDHVTAFERYERKMRSYVEQNQRIAVTRHEMSIPRSEAELEALEQRMRELQHGAEQDQNELYAMMASAANSLTVEDY